MAYWCSDPLASTATAGESGRLVRGQRVVRAVDVGAIVERGQQEGRHRAGGRELPRLAPVHDQPAGRQDQEPYRRPGAEEGDRGKGRRAHRGAADVPQVAGQGVAGLAEDLKALGERAAERHERQRRQHEHRQQGQPKPVDHRRGRRQIVVQQPQVLRRRLLRDDRAAQQQRRADQREQARAPQMADGPVARGDAADAQPQERGDEDQIGKVGERPDLLAHPADEQQLLEQHGERDDRDLDPDEPQRGFRHTASVVHPRTETNEWMADWAMMERCVAPAAPGERRWVRA